MAATEPVVRKSLAWGNMIWCGYMLVALLESVLVTRQVARHSSNNWEHRKSFANVPLAGIFAILVFLYIVCLAERYTKPINRERLSSLQTSEGLAKHLRKASEAKAKTTLQDPETKKTL
jgi:hypothetical protein